MGIFGENDLGSPKRSFNKIKHELVAAIRLIAVVYLLVIVSLLAPYASAQTEISVIGPASSPNVSSPASRRSFYDPVAGVHWVFWSNNGEISYASSSDERSWTTRSTLPYNSPNFSLVFKSVSGVQYVYLVAQANSFDVIMRRGVVSGDRIDFDSEVTIFDGNSSNDKYIAPQIALDIDNKAWVLAFKDLGDVGERYLLSARRVDYRGGGAPVLESVNFIGKPSVAFSGLVAVPLSGGRMLATVSGESHSNVVAYEFDGSLWKLAGSGGDYGELRFAELGTNGAVSALVVDPQGNLYMGGSFTRVGGVAVNYIAKWDGSEWSTLGSGVNSIVDSLALDTSGNLYVGGSFTYAGDVLAFRIAKWNGASWSALQVGFNNRFMDLAIDSAGSLYAGGDFTQD